MNKLSTLSISNRKEKYTEQKYDHYLFKLLKILFDKIKFFVKVRKFSKYRERSCLLCKFNFIFILKVQ